MHIAGPRKANSKTQIFAVKSNAPADHATGISAVEKNLDEKAFHE